MADWLDRCHFGDCRDLLPMIPAGVADAVIADPPYGDTSLKWDRVVDGWIEACARTLKPVGSIWVFGSLRFIAPTFDLMKRAGFIYSQDIVWRKQNGSGFNNDRFRRVHEHAVLFYRGAWSDVYKCPQVTHDAKARTVRQSANRAAHTGSVGEAIYRSVAGGPRFRTSVLDIRNEHGRAVHPTQKPVDLVELLVRYSVPPGGIVLDPFLGSGSTALAAIRNSRHWIGCEIDSDCRDIQTQRLQQEPLVLEIQGDTR
ncbi:DNA-methyltransferase [Burkholderia plantarii]|uniref:DNA-methyltransferase n=1 Tax=Burkholderia plantarii TaxID=41899 RepID=UPI00087090C4|nr:site-specific DNA-methyltransferase [Burkholderia plantarii]